MIEKNYVSKILELNLPPDKNLVGQNGEDYARYILGRSNLFNIAFLGDKFPVEDFFGEIRDADKPYGFLIQVKTTNRGTTEENCLNARLPSNKRDELIKRPLPTYLFGVDSQNNNIYICPVFDKTQSYSTVPPKCVINIDQWDELLNKLNNLKWDIINYWETIKITSHKSTYKSTI